MSDKITAVRDTFSDGRDLMKRIVEQNEEIVKMNAKMVDILAMPPPMVLVPPVIDGKLEAAKDFTWRGRRGG